MRLNSDEQLITDNTQAVRMDYAITHMHGHIELVTDPYRRET